MIYLSNELLECGLHYNQLNVLQKYEVCMFWDSKVNDIRPKNFDGSYRRIFENAKKMKTRYEYVYGFGIVDEIPEHLDFRSLNNKDFAASVLRELYSVKRIEHARLVASIVGIKTQKEEQDEIFRLNDIVRLMAVEMDKFEKEVQDLNDSAKHFAREGKILYSEFLSQLKYQRTIDKPETQVHVDSLSQ